MDSAMNSTQEFCELYTSQEQWFKIKVNVLKGILVSLIAKSTLNTAIVQKF